MSIEKEWQHENVYISTFYNEHMAVDSDTKRLTVVRGITDKERETFTLGTKYVVSDTNTMQFLCYFSQQINDVTYYVTVRDESVILQGFADEPKEAENDNRVFEVVQNKKRCQFKSVKSKDMYLCMEEDEFSLQDPSDKKMEKFQFDISPVQNT